MEKGQLDYTVSYLISNENPQQTKSFKTFEFTMMEHGKATPMNEANAELERFIDPVMGVRLLLEERIDQVTDTVLKPEGGRPSAAEAESAKAMLEEWKNLFVKMDQGSNELNKIEGDWREEFAECYNYGL
ncbi:MAG: hypothetical protein Q9199_004001 [Rusavskia elegans]